MNISWVIYLSELVHLTLQPPLPQIVINFTKDQEKDYCNTMNFDGEKNQMIVTYYSHSKNIHNLKMKFETLRNSKYFSKFSKFQESFITCKWGVKGHIHNQNTLKDGLMKKKLQRIILDFYYIYYFIITMDWYMTIVRMMSC